MFAGPLGNLLAEGAKAPPTEFRILKAGWNETVKGRFLFDEDAGKAVMAQYAVRGLDKIQIDYEHQSSVPPPGGGRAEKPAAGWFKPEVRGGELWAVDLNWTTNAARMIAPETGAPEYRYFSPILFFNEESRRVSALKNLALTNDPAMNGIEAIVAASALALDATDADEETPMECKACTTLTAQLTAKDAELSAMKEQYNALSARLSSLEEKDKEGKAAMTSLTARHGDLSGKLVALTGQQSEAGALGLLESWKTKAAQTDSLLAEKESTAIAALTGDMGRILDKAVAEKKLTPAMRPFEEKAALAMGGGKVSSASIEFLTAKWGAAAPVVVNPERKTPPEEGEVTLTASDYEAARLLGHDPEWVLKNKKELAKKQRAAAAAASA